MEVVIRQKLKRAKPGYYEERIIQPVNNTEIFKRISGFEKSDSSIYIWMWKGCNCNIDYGFGIKPEYKPIYIGKGDSFGEISNWRAFTHSNDLLDDVIKKNPCELVCYIPVIGTSEENAKALESYLIETTIEKYGYKLTDQNSFKYNIKSKKLINKRREPRADEFLNFNNQWK